MQIWYGLILLAVLAGFGATAYQLERGRRYRELDDELQRRLGSLAQALAERPRPERMRGQPMRPPPGDELPPERFEREPQDGPGFGPPEDGPPLPAARSPLQFRARMREPGLFDESDTNSFYFALWRRDGTELIRSTNAPPGLAMPRPAKPGQQPQRSQPLSRGVFREAVMTTPPGEMILVGRNTLPERAGLRRTALTLGTVGAGILLLGLAGGWWLASRAIRPIQDITSTASKIAAGDLSHRIDTQDTETELGQLAAVLNSTFSRLDAAFAQQKQFSSDAAHELRTPVSVLLTQTQGTLSRERSAGEYRETLEACQRAAQRMRRLIESLLELARLDAGQEPMKRERFDLAALARDCAESIRPLAAEKNVTLTCALPEITCSGDAERVSQVLTNLLANAVHYNKPGGQVHVTGANDGGSAILEVRDTGQGIPAEDLPHVFKRFYRADKSRSAARTGLGLAIAKAVIDAHGGEISIRSTVNEGTTVTLRLPA